MPCMCGDLYCLSCGPAQGNGRCNECGAWDDDGGCVDPRACEAADRARARGEAEAIRIENELALEYALKLNGRITLGDTDADRDLAALLARRATIDTGDVYEVTLTAGGWQARRV
jgi:hypothetical protein